MLVPALLSTIFPVLFASDSVDSAAPSREKLVIDRFWEILVKSPRRGTTFDRVYGYYVDTGRVDLLLEQCRRRIEDASRKSESSPGNESRLEEARARLLCGLVLQRRGENESAESFFREAVQENPDDALAPFYLAETLIARARLPEAVEALEEAVRRKPARSDILVVLQTLGQIRQRLGETEKARHIWTELERLFPDDPEIRGQIAETLEAEGRLDEAATRYERLAAESRDDFLRVRFTLAAADIKWKQGRENEALDDFDRLLDRLAPESWPAESVRLRVDRLFRQDRDTEGLARFYRRRLEKQPGDPATVERLVELLRQTDRREEARSLLEEALEKTPRSVRLRLALIELLVSEKKIPDAIRQYRFLDELQPNNTDYLTRWGQLILENPELDESARKDEAWRIWKRMIEVAPNDPVRAVSLADLLLRNGLIEQAEQQYRRAVELRPEDPTYREYLAMFYHGRKDKERFLAALRPIAEGARRDADSLTQLGSILLTLGYVEEALQPLQEAVRLAPDDPGSQWYCVEALLRRNRPGDVEAALSLLASIPDPDENAFEAGLLREIRLLRDTRQLERMSDNLANRLENDPAATGDRRSWWRLAVYRQALSQTIPAVEAIERALALGEPSARLLRAAADLYEQSEDGPRALAIYDRLVRIDGVWRVDNLKRQVRLLLKLGQKDKAVEAGRLLAGIGSGNAENVRFFADLLLELGRRAEAIDVLRQALRIEPGDVTTLSRLAEALEQDGQEEDAAEIVWRLFEKTETIDGKRDMAEKLAHYARRSGSADELIRRLRGAAGGTATEGRNAESLFCLAKVHETLDDLPAASRALEDLLDDPILHENKSALDRATILREIVSVAEKRQDLAGAVRFQERLCRESRNPADLERLFMLYDKSGDTHRVRDLFLRQVLQKTGLEDRLDSIDRMIRREQYDVVERVLDFFDVHESPDWQLLLRRIAVESYQGRSVEDFVWDLRDMPLTPADNDDGATVRPPTEPTVFAFPLPWLLPGAVSNAEPFETFPFVPREFQASIRRQELYLSTVFRDRLARNELFYSPLDAPLPKPFLAMGNQRDARFLALVWLLKEAIDDDLQNDSPTWNRFRETVDLLRDEIPDDSREPDLLRERLRLETLLIGLARLDGHRNFLAEGKLAPLIDVPRCEGTIRRIIRRLDEEKVDRWEVAAFHVLAEEGVDEQIVRKFSGEKGRAAIEKLLDETARERKLDFLVGPSRDRILQEAFLRVETARLRLQSRREGDSKTADDPEQGDDGRKRARLLEIWRQSAGAGTPEQSRTFVETIAPKYPVLLWLFRDREETDGERALKIVNETLREFGTAWPEQLAGLVALSEIVDETTILFPELADYRTIEERLGRLEPWLKEASVSIADGEKNVDSRQVVDAALATLESLLVSDRSGIRVLFQEPERTQLEADPEQLRDLLRPGRQTPSSDFLRRLVGLTDYDFAGRRATLTADQLFRLEQFRKGLDRLQEFAFELMEQRGTDPPERSLEFETDDPPPLRPGTLAKYREELVGNRTVDRGLLKTILKDRPYFAPLTAPQRLFLRSAVIRRAVDTSLKYVDFDIDGRRRSLPGDGTEHLRLFLEEKEKDRPEIVALLRDVLDDLVWPGKPVRPETADDFQRLTRQLENVRSQRATRGRPRDPVETLALALLSARGGRFQDVVPLLDEIPLKAQQDVRAREFVAVILGIRLVNEAGKKPEKTVRDRTDRALNRLLGYRLSDPETLRLISCLKMLDHPEKADEMLRQLIETTRDWAVLLKLLGMADRSAGDPRNAPEIARRVLRHPSLFQDAKQFSHDYRIYSSALNILREHDKLGELFQQIEAKCRPVQNETDRSILLLELCLAADRYEKARHYAGELVRRPTRDPERRGIVTRGLQRLGMNRELDEMNRRLMERDDTSN